MPSRPWDWFPTGWSASGRRNRPEPSIRASIRATRCNRSLLRLSSARSQLAIQSGPPPAHRLAVLPPRRWRSTLRSRPSPSGRINLIASRLQQQFSDQVVTPCRYNAWLSTTSPRPTARRAISMRSKLEGCPRSVSLEIADGLRPSRAPRSALLRHCCLMAA